MSATVVIIAALDTKGEEAAFVRDVIQRRGGATWVVDTGIMGEPAFTPDTTREEVARAADTTISDLQERADRGHAVERMGSGAARIVADLHADGRLDGMLGFGGSAGTSMAAAAAQVLPVGVPKFIVSTIASGDVSPYVDIKDVTMMHSVVDIAGLNRISRRVLANAAAACLGMAEEAQQPIEAERPVVAATMFGVTTPCVTAARHYLEERGYEVLVFHATGSGGRAMEGLVQDGLVHGVLDVTTTEWCDELVGGVLSAGPERLEAMAEAGVPHVVAPGALDMVNFGPPHTVPDAFKDRLFYQHNPQVTLMRTTKQENAELGRIIAEKLNMGSNPKHVFLPLRGVSALDQETQPFWNPAADEAFRQALQEHLDAHVPVTTVDYHINDEAFARTMAEELVRLLAEHDGPTAEKRADG